MKTRSRFIMTLCLVIASILVFSQLLTMNVDAMGRDKVRPTAPQNLAAKDVTDTSFTLTWTASTDNVGIAAYYIYKDNVLAGTSTVPSFNVTNLLPDTTYSFFVRAKDPTGNPSPNSLPLSVTTSPSSTQPPAIHKKIVAYYTSWSAYHDFTPDKIAATKVTHINYAFANIGNNLQIELGDATIDPQNFIKLNALKKFNPNLKILISVGGWSWSGKFSDVASSQTNRDNFAASCVRFIDQYHLDGVDLDWEYPVSGGLATNTTRPEDKQNFTLLLQTMRAALGTDHLLTIAGGANQEYFDNVELVEIFKSIDFANIMTYDFHGGWDKLTDFNAPLYTDASSPQPIATMSADAAVKLWLSLNTGSAISIPNDKIVLGIPFYGKKYGAVKNTNATDPGLYSSYGRCTTVTYKEIMQNYWPNTAYKRYFLNATQVPWLFNGSTFISYDDAQSIQSKISYIIQNNLGGAMVWELSQDDGDKLISVIFDGLKD